MKTFPMSLVDSSTVTPPRWFTGELYYGKIGDWAWTNGGGFNEDDHMQPYLDTCVNCAKK